MRELRHILAHLSDTSAIPQFALCSKDLLPVAILSGNTKPAGRDIRAAQSANRIYVAVTLPFSDPSLSPISLAEQPPSLRAAADTTRLGLAASARPFCLAHRAF